MLGQNLMMTVSGLGLFLFGMLYMEHALREAAGRRLKGFIRKSTETLPRSLSTGVLATVALQSSSVVSLMTLSFVGAGLMTLASGIGVIFGANLGTTVTAWMLVLFGFKVSIESFALPIVGFSGLILVFSPSGKLGGSAKVLIGFGLLFLGLGYMKSGTEGFAALIDYQKYLGYPPWVYLLLGLGLTASIQSSSASTAIVLSLLNANIVTFPVAAAMVIGGNVGTTVTILLGSLGGTPDKKRVAWAHVTFNVLTGLVTYFLLPPLSRLILDLFDLKSDPTLALAIFHSLFNLLGVALLSPWTPWLAKGLQKLFVAKEEPLTRYIDKVDTSVPEAALAALKNETRHLFERVLAFGAVSFDLEPMEAPPETKPLPARGSYLEQYRDLKRLEMKIIEFTVKLGQQPLSEVEVQEVDGILRSVRDLVFAAKSLKDVKPNIEDLSRSPAGYEADLYGRFRDRWASFAKGLSRMLRGDSEAAAMVLAVHEKIEAENEGALRGISETIRTYSMDEVLASSILNLNRSFFLAAQAIAEAARLQLFK